ncbi:MAG: hypothetical protein O7C74_03720, partial [Acidobacteria bacterium]|nr:hypothetical protein [Acidobacteriota bacterium]
AGTLAFILTPLFQNQTLPAVTPDHKALDAFANATSRRDTSYEALADLEFDFAAGKISQEDFTRLKQQYQMTAVAALKDLDAVAAAGTH